MVPIEQEAAHGQLLEAAPANAWENCSAAIEQELRNPLTKAADTTADAEGALVIRSCFCCQRHSLTAREKCSLFPPTFQAPPAFFHWQNLPRSSCKEVWENHWPPSNLCYRALERVSIELGAYRNNLYTSYSGFVGVMPF